MHRIIFTFLSTLMVIVFSACDKLEEPFRVADTNSIETNRKVLLEDFSGHTCGNCPEAANIAQTLSEQYGENLVIITHHVGFFAEPQNNPDGSFYYDFRTLEGNQLDQFFGLSNAGLPRGMVNRRPVDGSPVLGRQAWASAVAEEITREVEAEISITPEITGQILNVSVTTQFWTKLDKPHRLTVYLTEDSIINWQLDYSQSPDKIPDYVHRHAMRKSFNDFNGELIGNSFKYGDLVQKNYSLTLDAEWKQEHLAVVAFIFNMENKVIIQAEEVHAIPD